jgi:hypothetical protein
MKINFVALSKVESLYACKSTSIRLTQEEREGRLAVVVYVKRERERESESCSLQLE